MLFRIDAERFSLALRQEEAVVAGKRASAEQAKADYNRYAQLNDVAVSQQRLELARANSQEATAACDQTAAYDQAVAGQGSREAQS